MKTFLVLGSSLAFSIIYGTASERPNIVYILADDLGYGSVGCYGNELVETPHIDELARTGVRLSDYHTCPYSTPTRVSFLTGRYAHRAAWVDDSELSPIYREQRKRNMKQRWAWGISENEVTIAEILKDAGYRTGLIGKWHLGYDEKFNPVNFGFDVFQGHLGGACDGYTHKAHYGKKELDWWNQNKLVKEEGYSYDLILQKSICFIEESSDKPFFLFLSHPSPHDPFVGRNRDMIKSKSDIYKEMIEELDRCVGEIKRILEKNGLLNRTLFIFCSDNGAPQSSNFFEKVNGPYRGYKGGVLEGGIRVPFIASFPDVLPKGIVCDETITIMDWLPTFAKLCGAKIPDGIMLDGVDVLEAMQGKKKLENRSLFWEVDGSWAVRKGNWKLLGGHNNQLKLINLPSDMDENINLTSRYPHIAKQMRQEYELWIKSCRFDMKRNL